MAAWWPFGRGRKDAPAPTEVPRPTASAEPSGPVVVPTPRGDAWRDVPPLRPSWPAIELTAPVQRLADTMTSKQHTGVTDDALGHARAADGPAGTVVGLLKPSVAMHRERADQGPLIYAAAAPEPVAAASAVPLRRGGGRTYTPTELHASTPPAPAVEPASPDAPPVESAVPSDPTSSHRSPTPASGLQMPVGSRSLAPPAVPAAGAQRLPAASTDLPPIAIRPLPVRERAAPTAPTEPTPMPVAVLDAALVEPAATTSSAASAPFSTAPLSTEHASSTGSETPRAERSPLVGSTRIVRRIGEPLRERPASMVSPTESSTADTASRAPLAIRTSVAPLTDPEPVAPHRSVPEPGVVPARAARAVASIDVASTAHSPTQRSDPDDPSAHRPRSTRPLVGARSPIQRLAGTPGGATALGRADPGGDDEPVPVRWEPPAQRRVQRAPEGVPADLQAELEPLLGTPLADVRVHRDAETGEAARQLSAKAFTAGGEVFLPEWHGSTSGGEARTILSHELTHVAQQRRLGSALPDEASPAGATLESEALAVAGQGPPVPTRPVASGTAAPASQRLRDEQPSPPSRALPHRAPSRAMSPTEVVARVQAAATAAGIGSDPPTAGTPRPQGSAPLPTWAVDSAGSSDSIVSSTVQRLPDDVSSVPAPAPPLSSSADSTQPATDDPAQLEELARRLYPRFRTRLRQDLLADRERSGRLFDVR